MRNKASLLVGFALLLAGVLLFFRYSTTSQVPEQVSTTQTEEDLGEMKGGVVAVLDSPNASETFLASPAEQGGEDEETADEVLPTSETAVDAPGGAWIRGYVMDAGGRGIADAEILLGLDSAGGKDLRAFSGVDGAFEIGGLAEEQFLVGARYPGYAPAYVRAVASRVASDSARIVLGRGGVLEGHVTYAGEPFSDYRIGVFHLADNTTGEQDVSPDAQGFYRIDALAPGAYEVRLMMNDPATGLDLKKRIIRAKAVIEEGRTTEADFDFPAQTSSFEGQITVNGVAPKKAYIMLALVSEGKDEEQRRADADSDGYYRFEELGSGRAQLSVRAESLEGRIFFTVVRNVSVPELENVSIDIELLSGAFISGRVSGVPEDFEAGVIVLPGDVEVSEVSLEGILDMYQTATVVIDAMGSDEFHATGLDAGTYTVLFLAFKETASDFYGETITGSYLVELGEGEEVFIEHSFE